MVFLIAAIIFAFLMYKFMDEDFLGIAFSAGFVFSVTLALGQLGMESLLLRLILSAAAWFILGMIFEELPVSSSSASSSPTTIAKKQDVKSPSGLNIDNDYFLIKDGRLLEWRGESNTIIVPQGVRIIGGNDDTAISKKTIDSIYIPRSVWKIADSALPHVQTVYCEGFEESLSYDKECNFYTGGWVADWSKSNSPVRIYKVDFRFNYSLYQAIVDAHYKDHPDELLPRSKVKAKNGQNPDYIFAGDFLRQYTGADRALTVPSGTYLIGNNDDCFSTNVHCFEAVYIPRSVRRIKESTILFTEEIYYEGSQSEWNAIEIESGNFRTDYTPDYYKEYYKDIPHLRDSKVMRVNYVYNTSRTEWDKIVEAIHKRHP